MGFFSFCSLFICVFQINVTENRRAIKNGQSRETGNKGNNKITELRTILQRESQNS